MHYVNCVYCDATYSMDGNPFYYNDYNDHVCENCVDDLLINEKSIEDGKVIYQVSHECLTEFHQEFCEEIKRVLKSSGINFSVENKYTTETIFKFTEEEVLLAELQGKNIDYLMFY